MYILNKRAHTNKLTKSVATMDTGFLDLTIEICRVVFLQYGGGDKSHEHIKLES
jgi:hypothetical protein